MNNDMNDHDRIKQFIRKKQILSLSFSLSIAIPFFIFVFTMAFKSEWLSFSYDNAVNIGLWLSFGLIVLVFALIWLFVKWKTTHDSTHPHDIDEVKKND